MYKHRRRRCFRRELEGFERFDDYGNDVNHLLWPLHNILLIMVLSVAVRLIQQEASEPGSLASSPPGTGFSDESSTGKHLIVS